MEEKSEKRVVHCWKGKSDHIAETVGIGHEWGEAYNDDATCMLEHGHDGPHGWVSDKSITVEFAEPSHG